MSVRNKEVIEKVNAAFARNDMDTVLSYCADEFEWTMVGDKPIKGKEAVRKWMASAPPEPPKFTVNTVLADGDFVTAIGDMTMTEKGAVAPYSYCDVWAIQRRQARRAEGVRHQDRSRRELVSCVSGS